MHKFLQQNCAIRLLTLLPGALAYDYDARHKAEIQRSLYAADEKNYKQLFDDLMTNMNFSERARNKFKMMPVQLNLSQTLRDFIRNEYMSSGFGLLGLSPSDADLNNVSRNILRWISEVETNQHQYLFGIVQGLLASPFFGGYYKIEGGLLKQVVTVIVHGMWTISPILESTWPQFMQQSLAGWVFAHELTHAVDYLTEDYDYANEDYVSGFCRRMVSNGNPLYMSLIIFRNKTKNSVAVWWKNIPNWTSTKGTRE